MTDNAIDIGLRQSMQDQVKEKVVWTNASPSSNFAAQKINVDLTNYDSAKIKAAASASSDNIIEIEIPVDKTGSLAKPLINSLRYREVVAVEADGVTFDTGENASWNGSSTTNNSQLIPLAIYGIKVVGGVIHKLITLATRPRREVLA